MLTSYKLKRSTFYYVAQKLPLNYEYKYRPRRDDITSKSLCNLARAKRNLRSILRLNLTPFSSFLTLTYADNITDYDKFAFDFKMFKQKLKTDGIQFQYVGVKELQERGAIHAHIVIFNDLRHIDFAKYWTNGFVYLKPVKDYDHTTTEKLSNYLAKYLVSLKKNALIKKEKKLYFASRNIKREKILDLSPVHYLQLKNKADYIFKDTIGEKLIISHKEFDIVL